MLNCLNHLLLGKRTQRAGKLYSVSVSKAEKKPQRLAVFLSRKPGEKAYGRLLQNILGFFLMLLDLPHQIQLVVILRPMPNSSAWQVGSGRATAL